MIICNHPYAANVGESLRVSPNNGIGLVRGSGSQPGQQTKGAWQGGTSANPPVGYMRIIILSNTWF